MATEVHHTFCRICESLCGLDVTVTDGVVTQIRADDQHVASAGFACIKGLKQHKLYASPDRLLHPMRRRGDSWERTSWAEANGEIGARLRRIIDEHGPDSVAMYVGTAAGFSVLHPAFAQGFMDGIGSSSLYSSATQDCSNKFAAAREIYGFPFTQPFPDIDRTQTLVIVGANPVVSKWSFLQVSDPTKRLRQIAERGGQVIVVDPRFTETARAATRHVPIRPDTDVFFYLSFLHELFARDGVDPAARSQLSGIDDLRELVAPWSPERTAEVTRIDAATLRGIVDAYLAADGAALYSSTGVNMGTNGVLGFWLQEAINALTGNLDRPGGTLVGQGVMDFARFGVRTGTLMSEDTSRIGGFRKVNDAYAGGVLADEILTPGPRQVRALIVTGGNPLITMADAGRLRDAFEQLDLLVTIDIYRNETGSVADYVLPATDPLQRPDLPFIFPLLLGMQSKPYLQATRAAVRPDGEQRDEATIYLGLAKATGVGLFGSRAVQRLLEAATRRHTRRLRRDHPDAQPAVPQEGLLDLLLRATRQPSFRRLLRSPHGVVRTEQVAGSFLGSRVVTDDGLVHLAPARLLERASGLEAAFERERAAKDRLKLITKRATKTHNSWTHNHEEMVSGPDGDTNHLYVHPDDAARLGLADGDLADVSTDVATVRVPVRLLDDLTVGTVALPHGWGHQHATGLSVASRTRGVNVNLLAASGPDHVDPASGMSHLTGLPVDVAPAAGPQDPTDWSGISATERAGATPVTLGARGGSGG